MMDKIRRVFNFYCNFGESNKQSSLDVTMSEYKVSEGLVTPCRSVVHCTWSTAVHQDPQGQRPLREE